MIKKTLSYLTLALAFAGLSSSAYAGCNNGQCNDNSNDNCCDDSKFDLSVHALLAKPCQGVTWLEVNVATANAVGQGSFKRLDYDWDLGIAAAASFKFCDEWSLGLRYSYIQADGDDSFNGSALLTADVLTLGNGIDATGHEPRTETGIADNHGIWGANLETEMHTLDILAQYDCCLCGNFKFKPFGGIRFLKVENDYSVKATAVGQVYTSIADGLSSKYDMTAYGVVGGFDWEFGLCGDFYLIGSVSGSALAADSETSWKHTLAGAATSHYNYDPDCDALLAFESNVGLAWNTCLFGKGFDVQALYETRYLSNVANFANVTDAHASNQYGVHGFKLGVGVSF